MSLSSSQLSSVSFLTHLKKVDPDFLQEISLEYAEDVSTSFAVESFLAEDDDFKELWELCDKRFFFGLLIQESVMTISSR